MILDEYITAAKIKYDTWRSEFTHFFTLTINPIHKTKKLNAQYNYLMDQLWVYHFLSRFFGKWIMVFEITKNKTSPMLHIHGLGYFHDDVAEICFIDNFRKHNVFGQQYDCRPIHNVENVWTYMLKDLPKTFAVLNAKGYSIYREVIHYCEACQPVKSKVVSKALEKPDIIRVPLNKKPVDFDYQIELLDEFDDWDLGPTLPGLKK